MNALVFIGQFLCVIFVPASYFNTQRRMRLISFCCIKGERKAEHRQEWSLTSCRTINSERNIVTTATTF